MNFDELKSEILSLEDFDSVDEGLMTEINKSEELCRLFEEMKALSALVGSSAPSPTKDGVTLHDAVMKRIECGDTAPRYIYKRKYPIATAACLLVCMAVVLIARTGFGNFAEKEAFDAASPETALLSDGMENGAADYKFETFSFDEAADEEAPITADSVKFKSATVTAKGNAEFQAAPTEAAPEAEECEAATDSSEVFDDGRNSAVYDKSNSAPHRMSGGGSAGDAVSGGGSASGAASGGGSAGGTASGGSVMLSKPYSGALSDVTVTEETLSSEVFYFEGNSYTVFEVFEMYRDGTLPFDINSDDFDKAWAACFEAVGNFDDGADAELIRFITDNYEKSLE